VEQADEQQIQEILEELGRRPAVGRADCDRAVEQRADDRVEHDIGVHAANVAACDCPREEFAELIPNLALQTVDHAGAQGGMVVQTVTEADG
jgi:hypothetical protein